MDCRYVKIIIEKIDNGFVLRHEIEPNPIIFSKKDIPFHRLIKEKDELLDLVRELLK